MKTTSSSTSCSLLGVATLTFAMLANTAQAATFINGGFEDGTINGWTTGGGSRTSTSNSTLAPTQFLPGGSLYAGPSPRSAIISAGTVDPNIGAALGSTVYSGNFSYRAEDTSTGGFASAISQKVTNYTDPNVFFAWKAVLENGGHTQDQSAEMVITLRDDTTGTNVISRIYNAGAGGGGVDTRFTTAGDLFYTSQWQIEQIVIDQSLAGHDFTLSLLAADCLPAAHTGYAYLDGFGGVLPDADNPGTPGGTVPEPGTTALLGLGLFGFVASRRKSAKSKNA
jgi:hypothetical protein